MAANIKRMKELVDILDKAAKSYYQESREIMSNYEYDKLYDELLNLEKETDTVLAKSPTIRAGYEVLSELQKEKHATPMLSLDKTKDVQNLKEWLGHHKGLLSWKLDGLTVVIHYRDGKLSKAVTRGNGTIGEIITNNARVFKNLPHQINFLGELVLRGEAVIRYSDFEKMNNEIEDVDAKYKNPRNLCSGSVRQLNNEITAKRNVYLYAFSLLSAEGITIDNSKEAQMNWIKELGFDVVENICVDENNLEDTVKNLSERIIKNDFPSDGLVLTYDDSAYGKSLGRTSKFPKDSIAFKWVDEIRETTLKEVEWSTSRTGLINPIAVFEPVELEGTTVSRASLHNISIMEALELGIGDTIQVYKANMIIPQIADNLTRSGNMPIPSECPVCSGKTRMKQENDVKSLYCTNLDCQAKKMKLFSHFVSRDAINIDGLSEASIEKFIAKGFIKKLSDLFHLSKYKDEIIAMEGFGEKSYANLMESLSNACKTTLPRLIYSLGIPGIGRANAKLICKELSNDINQIQNISKETLMTISGMGEVLADAFYEYFHDEENLALVNELLNELVIDTEQIIQTELLLDGITFVITGSLIFHENRDELKEIIEQKGGKVTGTVTNKTNYLINNDTTSNSSKNKKAKELGVKIISEEDFNQLILPNK